LGDVPMYRMPGLILGLLGDQRPAVMRLLEGDLDGVVRPLPGMHLVSRGSSPMLCRHDQEPGPGCAESQRWLGAVVTATHDLFGGDQHLLRQLSPSTAEVQTTEFDVDPLSVGN